VVASPSWDGLALGPTPSKGLGVFATRAIAEGALIMIVDGPEEAWQYDDEPGYGATYYGVGRGRWVVPPEDSPPRFVNHACEPSARMADPRTIVAARAIAAGEEVTIDYATTEEDPGWSLDCRCGAASCRGVVRGTARFGE
jgi:SET domain-containing protein